MQEAAVPPPALQAPEVIEHESEASKLERQITYPFGNTDCRPTLDRTQVDGWEVIHDAVTYLKTSSDVTMALCLYGMGGIGKSFLGLKIFTEFQKSTYRDCHIELQFETRPDELNDIQEQIIKKVCKHATSKLGSLLEGRQIMEIELKKINDPIFLYVDNILEHRYLPDLLPKSSVFPKGSRILITSRGEYIEQGIVDLGITDYELIEVRKLQKQPAQQLLWEQLECKGEHRDNSEVKSLEDRVLELCDGLPLALILVGKYIANNESGFKDVEVWREVVDAMQKAEALEGGGNDMLYSRIIFSIQHLDQNVKGAFLDIIFLVDIRDAWNGEISWGNIEYLVGNNTYLKVLCQRGLVQKREKSTSQIEIAIHDVLMAIGKRMVDDDKQELRITGMNRFELHSNALDKVVALEGVTVDAYMLKQMPLLRLLQDVKVEGEDQEIQLRHLRVVHGLVCLTTRVFDWSVCASLKVITWGDVYDWRADDYAPNVSNLEVFKHDKISMRLEALELYIWRGLTDVNAIETLTCLKKLRLYMCEQIESLPEGISRLTGLKHLRLHDCRSLKCLPQGVSSLTCLEVLDLTDCENIQSLPEGLTTLTCLTELYLSGCSSLQSIPENIRNLRAVTHFTLSECQSLESIPEGATHLMSPLTALSLRSCIRIKYLPEGVTRLTGLKQLDLGMCISLRCLPEGVSGLTGLTSLGLECCKRLQTFPEDIASLSGLIKLDLSRCRALQYLPKELLCLTDLRDLRLNGCARLQALPEKLGFMTGLSLLNLSGCESLQFLPEEISKLTSLIHLDLSDCKSLQSIEGVTALTALTILKVRNCAELQLLPDGITKLTSLMYIGLSGCTSLKSIPEGLGLTGFHKLPAANSIVQYQGVDTKCLDLSECESLKSLPQSIGSFTLLRELRLGNCTSLEFLPEGVTRLSNLANLSLLGCRSLQCLPRGLIGSLTGLRELKLGECAMLFQPFFEEVWCKFARLNVLQLSGFEDLQSLPQGITSLMRLENLSLSGCKNLQLLPQGMANWMRLRRLDLSGCRSLRSLPEELRALTSLFDLNLSGCAGLQSLPEQLTALTALMCLNLSGCAGLRSLPQGIFTSLAGLRQLNMSECGRLQLQESQGITRMANLRSLDLSESEHLLSHEQGIASLNLSECRSLNLSGCRSLQSLPEGLAALKRLDELKLTGCASLQSLSNLTGGMWGLDLGGCASLDQASVWETILSFKHLNWLILSGWETMQALPEGVASLQRLNFLDLSKCSSLLSLPESVTKLTDLRRLSLAECKSLQSLPPAITRLLGLHVLDLSGCTSLAEPLYPEEFSIWISGMSNYRPPQ